MYHEYGGFVGTLVTTSDASQELERNVESGRSL
jgi:hypothetical protein